MSLVVHLQHVFHRKLRITLCGSEPLVAEQLLDRTQIRSFFQHVRAECVTQGVRMNIRREPFGNRNLLDDTAHAAGGKASSAMIDQQSLGALSSAEKDFLSPGEIAG